MKWAGNAPLTLCYVYSFICKAVVFKKDLHSKWKKNEQVIKLHSAISKIPFAFCNIWKLKGQNFDFKTEYLKILYNGNMNNANKG